MLATIDGTDTKFSCNLANMLFSWVGAAALGGFLGQNVQAFVSAVISGAAGAYVLTLDGDADVGTDLVIQPGQYVTISGDDGSAEPPSWGSGGFAVGELASLSLAYLTITGAISAAVGASALQLSQCVLLGVATLQLHNTPSSFVATSFGGQSLSTVGGSVSVVECHGALALLSATEGASVSIVTNAGTLGGLTVSGSTFKIDVASGRHWVGASRLPMRQM